MARFAALSAAALAACVVSGCAPQAPPKPSSQTQPTAPPQAGPAMTPASGGQMVLIPGGEFRMGDAAGRSDETPHDVRVDSFYMDRTPVTQAHYQRVMDKNPSKWKGPANPVEQLRWREAAAFCNACSKLDGLTPCYNPQTWACDFSADGHRLPTEAEWEYACRAGATTRFFFGDNKRDLEPYAWFKRNSGARTRPVGGTLPNRWGLTGMCGNVWEWCHDWYAADYYQASPTHNPTGPATGEKRVLRGGAFNSNRDRCRAAYRFRDFPDYGDVCFGYDSYGFRRVRSSEGKPAATAPTSQTSQR